MSKFVLSYDAEYDKELNDLIETTPRKRRSERVRRLISLGLEYERRGGKGTNPDGPKVEEATSQRRPAGLSFRPPN